MSFGVEEGSGGVGEGGQAQALQESGLYRH